MKTKRYWADLGERAAWTFLQAALAVFTVTGGKDGMKAAAIAGVAAVLSMLKSLAASKIGNPDSASTVKSI